MNDLRKESKYGYLGRTALLTAAAAFLALLPAVIMGHGMLLLTDDFTWQQQIFNIYNASLLRSQPAWSWVVDLGSDPATALSFYNLNSPFTLIMAMFPAAAVPYLAAPMLVLKYATGAVGAALFAKKFVKSENTAVLCGLLYAFSGIQTVSLLFPFHDSMAIFPWVMVAFEKLLEGKPVCFAAAVALSAMTNYYLFFGEVIFLIIWFVFRVLLIRTSPKEKLVSFGKVLFEGIVGVMLAGVVLVPSFLAVASNPRVGSHDFGALYHVTQYVTLLQAYFMPADVMGSRNYLFQRGCSSCALSLPFIAMALVFTYIKKNFRKPKAYLPVLLVIISLVPVLNGAFSFFNTNYYARWFFMPALIFAMLSCVVIDRCVFDAEEEGYTRKDIVLGALINLTCVILTMLAEVALVLWYKVRGVTTMTENVNMTMLIVYGFFGQACAFGMLALSIKAKRENYVKAVTALVLAAGVITTGAAAVRYSTGSGSSKYYEPGIVNREGAVDAEQAKAILTASGGLADVFPKSRDYRVRYDWHEEGEDYVVHSFDNVAMLTGIPAVNSFISTVDGGLFKFYDLMGTERLVTTAGTFSEEEMALLSTRFYLTSNPDGGPARGTKTAEFSYPDGTTLYVYEYENHIPMGFTYSSYLTEDEVRELPADQRALALLSYIVLDQESVNEMSAAGIKIDHGNIPEIKDFEIVAEERKNTAATSFEMTDSGFNATFENAEPAVAFVSAAYSKGFTVKVNGETVKVYESAGLTAIPLKAGTNTVEAVYDSPGNLAGMILTGIAIVLGASEVIVFVLAAKIRKTKENKKMKLNNESNLNYNQNTEA